MSIPVALPPKAATASATASFAGGLRAEFTFALAAASSAAVQMIESSILGVDQQ